MALKSPAVKIDRLMAQRSMHEAQRDKQGARIVRDYSRAIDTLPGLDKASARIRRAARAGTYLMANRYDADGGEFTRVARLWGAVLNTPGVASRYPLRALLPGASALRAFATRTARSLGLR
jgi:hypothetical protein